MVGAYDSTNNVIKIFGGRQPFSQYIFKNETITYVNTTDLDIGISAEDASWVSFGDLIYYIDQTITQQNQLHIRSLNIQTLQDQIVWNETISTGTDTDKNNCINV